MCSSSHPIEELDDSIVAVYVGRLVALGQLQNLVHCRKAQLATIVDPARECGSCMTSQGPGTGSSSTPVAQYLQKGLAASGLHAGRSSARCSLLAVVRRKMPHHSEVQGPGNTVTGWRARSELRLVIVQGYQQVDVRVP